MIGLFCYGRALKDYPASPGCARQEDDWPFRYGGALKESVDGKSGVLVQMIGLSVMEGR